MYGWMGKILYIDLNSGKIEKKMLTDYQRKKFLGGRGLGVNILAEEIDPDVDPFSHRNRIVFSAGPLTATEVPTTGRMAVATKSPLTETIFDSNAGGHWGPELKRAGYDALVLSGKLEKLSRIKIFDDRVEILSCNDLKEEKTSSAWRKLKDNESDYKHLVIGPAGENTVRFASIAVGKNRTLGRGGTGGVLGCKNIKAISVRGSQSPEIADPVKIDEVKKKSSAWLKESSLTENRLNELGTAMLMNLINEAGVLPTHNFQRTQFPEADSISGENLSDRLTASKSSCYNCPIACSKTVMIDGEEKSGPEYESLGLLGANLGLGDPDIVTELNNLCDELGLDTISTGSVISCLMEMNEKNIVDSPVSFGQRKGIWTIIEKISRREGLGDELAEGSLRFAQKYTAPELAMQVKGLDIPAFDPRGMKGQALGYITSNRGACHQRANMMTVELLGLPEQVDRFSEENKAPLVVHQQNLNCILDSLIVCKFTLFALAEGFYKEMLSAVTGEEYSRDDFFKIGERIWNLERLFNTAAGFSRENDTLPARFGRENGSGPASGNVVNEEIMLDEYYKIRGWNENGIPEESKLKELELDRYRDFLPGR